MITNEDYNNLVYKYNEALDDIYNLKKQMFEMSIKNEIVMMDNEVQTIEFITKEIEVQTDILSKEKEVLKNDYSTEHEINKLTFIMNKLHNRLQYNEKILSKYLIKPIKTETNRKDFKIQYL